MSFFLARARGGAHEPQPPKPECSHRWRWAWLGVAWAASGCTLMADSFEPIGANGAEADDTPVTSGLLPAAAEGQRGSVPSSSPAGAGSGEGVVLPGREPVGANDGQLGGSSQEAEVADVGLPDTDAEVVLSNGGVPDAGAEAVVPSGDAPGAGGASPPGESCPSLAFGASCYEVFGELVSWGVAEQRCVDWGGHLASVGSPEEEGFLDGWPSALGIVDGDGSGIWLGGSDAALEGDFRWSDGSPLVFESWAPGQPDNGAGVDCIEKRNDGAGGWYDRRCTDVHRYVCERPL